jgi:hypothetical protein
MKCLNLKHVTGRSILALVCLSTPESFCGRATALMWCEIPTVACILPVCRLMKNLQGVLLHCQLYRPDFSGTESATCNAVHAFKADQGCCVDNDTRS